MSRYSKLGVAVFASVLALSVSSCGGDSDDTASGASSARPNQLLGTWRMVSAVSDPGGADDRPYGNDPNGLVTFSENGTFVEVLQNTDVPAFRAENRDEGTADEYEAAFLGAIGQYGTYTVDKSGAYGSDTLEGSTWPNRNGYRFTKPELNLIVRGNRLREELRSPGRPLLVIEFERVRRGPGVVETPGATSEGNEPE